MDSVVWFSVIKITYLQQLINVFIEYIHYTFQKYYYNMMLKVYIIVLYSRDFIYYHCWFKIVRQWYIRKKCFELKTNVCIQSKKL